MYWKKAVRQSVKENIDPAIIVAVMSTMYPDIDKNQLCSYITGCLFILNARDAIKKINEETPISIN